MNKKMGILGGLMMAAVVTGYSVCGTYAKYTSSLDFADEARVAKWNFNMGSTTRDINLFQESYEITKGKYDVVSREPGVKVVAPGTNGVYEFTIDGTAETNYTVNFSTTVNNTIKTTYKDEESGETKTYDPIYFRMTSGKEGEDDYVNTGWVNAEALEGALNNLFNDATVYAANYDLNKTVKIEWVWAFEGTDAETGHETNDVLDTELGRNAAQKDENDKLVHTVSIKTELTVTQSEAEAKKASNYSTLKLTTVPAEADMTALAEQFKYDVATVKNVKFDGKKLTGSILKSSEETDTAWNAPETATGYYFPVTVNAPEGTVIVFSSNPEKEHTIASDGTLTILQALNPESSTKTFNVTIKEAGKDVKTYTVDYSDVTFLAR